MMLSFRSRYEEKLYEFDDYNVLLRAKSNSASPHDPIKLPPNVLKRLSLKGYKLKDYTPNPRWASTTSFVFTGMCTFALADVVDSMGAAGCGGCGDGGMCN